MTNWHEIEYNQISSDWRHRDNLTWQIPSVIVVVGGALIAAAFGLSIDPCWVNTVRPLLLGFGTLFSLMLSIALVQNLCYQVGSGKALEKLSNGKGNEILKADGKMRRTLSPKDLGVSNMDFVRRIFSGLIGSTLLLLLCFMITVSLFCLYIAVI